MSELYIKTENRNGRTVVCDSYFTAPFKITQPFYNGGVSEIMIMQASAGILDGDSLDISFDIGSESKAAITGQSYTKLFKMDRYGAVQHTKINVMENGTLYYLPCPVIPFGGSDFKCVNEISLSHSSKFMLWDVVSCGRTGMGERFAFNKYHSRTLVSVDGKIIFVDNTRLIPKEAALDDIGFFEGYSHMGTAYFYGFGDLKKYFDNKTPAAVTKANAGQLVRILADSGEYITDFLKGIIREEEGYAV